MAELIAAYSPPIPVPAMNRVRYKNATQPVPAPEVAAVSPLPIRYTPRVTVNSLRRPSLSDSRPMVSGPARFPTANAIRYAGASVAFTW